MLVSKCYLLQCFNCLPVVAIIDSKIFCCHGGLSPELHRLEQIRQIQGPTDVPDSGEQMKLYTLTLNSRSTFVHRNTYCGAVERESLTWFLHSRWLGLLSDLLWSDPDKHVQNWNENDVGVSMAFGANVVKGVSYQALFMIVSSLLVLVVVSESTQHGLDLSRAPGR